MFEIWQAVLPFPFCPQDRMKQSSVNFLWIITIRAAVCTMQHSCLRRWCTVDNDPTQALALPLAVVCSQLTLLSCKQTATSPKALKQKPLMAASCFAAVVEPMQECRVVAHSRVISIPFAGRFNAIRQPMTHVPKQSSSLHLDQSNQHWELRACGRSGQASSMREHTAQLLQGLHSVLTAFWIRALALCR